MSTAPGAAFHYEIEHNKSEEGFNVTTVKCRGRLISENTGRGSVARLYGH